LVVLDPLPEAVEGFLARVQEVAYLVQLLKLSLSAQEVVYSVLELSFPAHRKTSKRKKMKPYKRFIISEKKLSPLEAVLLQV